MARRENRIFQGDSLWIPVASVCRLAVTRKVKGGEMKRFAIGLVVIAFFTGCMRPAAPPETSPRDVLHDISWANSLFDLYRHERLHFTFHAQLPGKSVQRQWVWHIKDGRIFLDGVEQEMGQAFVNDVYWLLFPLKAYESRDQVEVTVARNRLSPLGRQKTTEVVVRYVSGKGYTPDDTYKLYVDDNMVVREWSYLKGGQEPPARITTWSGYQTVGKMQLSLVRESREDFKVWFSDVRVE